MSNFLGFSDIEYIWNGEWSDPELLYKGKFINYWLIVGSMWEEYLEHCKECNIESTENGFLSFITDNSDMLYYFLDHAIGLID